MLVPIGVGTSISPYIQECKKIIEERNLTHKLESNGTAIKGERKDVFKWVENAMQKAIKKVTQGYLVISNWIQEFIDYKNSNKDK